MGHMVLISKSCTELRRWVETRGADFPFSAWCCLFSVTQLCECGLGCRSL